jgi:hypothetical protein
MRRVSSFLVVLAIAFFVVGYFRGWYTASATSSSHGSVSHGVLNLNLGIDADKIGSDVHAAKNRVSQAATNVLGKEQHADGTIMDVTKPNFTLGLSDGRRLTMEATSSAESDLEKARTGDHVSVDYREKDGKYVASSIRVERNN